MSRPTAHPDRNTLTVRIESPLVRSRQLGIALEFPFRDVRAKFSEPYVGYWDQSSDHWMVVERKDPGVRLLGDLTF